MCMVGDDYVQMLRDTKPVARKAHRCDECRRTIEPGETYINEVWLFEGELGRGKTCLQCRAAAHWLVMVCSGWIYEAVIDDLHEHIREEPEVVSSKLVRMVRYAKRGWRRRDDSLIPEAEVAAWAEEAVSRVPPEARVRAA